MPVSVTYPGVYVEEIPSGVRTIAGVATSITAFVGKTESGPVNEPTTIYNFGEYERIFGGLWAESKMGFAVRDFYMNGGGQAIIVSLGNGTLTDADYKGSQASKTGIYALEKADLFNLMCIPPYDANDNVGSTVIGEAAVYCEKRRAFLIVDPPSSWNSKQTAKTGFATLGTGSKNAAVFFPRLSQPNPLKNNQMETFAPCGAIAGVISRIDTNRGIWKAPAGLEAILKGVPGISVNLTDDENGELNKMGINCLRSKPPAGRIIWGARTLKGDDQLASEWKYISIRRTALYIEESLFRGNQWVVFEPNDEPLWAQIRLNVGSFMHNLFRQGAFQGQSPAEAYFVKCDKETTTQDDIDRGVVNILVGFAPLKPAEFVIIKLQQIAGQST